jgi:hypothetical protein
VRDNRRGKSNILYHINVCGPLPSGVTPACLGKFFFFFNLFIKHISVLLHIFFFLQKVHIKFISFTQIYSIEI